MSDDKEELDVEDVEDEEEEEGDDEEIAEEEEDADPGTPEALSADEAKYEREDAAVRPIQALARKYLGRVYARNYGRQCFIKEWDEERKKFAYVDTRRSPPDRYWTKPKWLGEEDLPEEQVYRAPKDYPPRVQTQRNFALVSLTAHFDDPNVPHLPSPKGVRVEYEELKDRMQNPFGPNFQAKDCQFMWEATKALFLKGLESLAIKTVTHIEAEAASLKARLDHDFLATLSRMYVLDETGEKCPLPTWGEASNFASPLLDEPAWRAFDKTRVALKHARDVVDKAKQDQADLARMATGGPPPKAKPAARPRTGQQEDESGDEPSAMDLHEAMNERKKLFDEWRSRVDEAQKAARQVAEQRRRQRRMLALRAKDPGRVIEEWELDTPEGPDEEEEQEVKVSGESAELKKLRADTLEAMKRVNRNKLALSAASASSNSTQVDVYRALGEVSPFRIWVIPSGEVSWRGLGHWSATRKRPAGRVGAFEAFVAFEAFEAYGRGELVDDGALKCSSVKFDSVGVS